MAEQKKTDRWVDEHGNALFAFALSRVSDRSVAEDLVQDTFLAALQSADSFESRSSERTWLTAILKHKVLDYYRRSNRGIAKKTEQAEDIDQYFDQHGHWKETVTPWLNTPDELLAKKEFVAALRECIDLLPQNQKAAFIAREIDDIEGDEICKKLGVSTTNLWVMMFRARDRLKRCLEANWFAKNELQGGVS